MAKHQFQPTLANAQLCGACWRREFNVIHTAKEEQCAS